jgi:hypothetical protein
MNIAYMDLAYTMKLGVKANRHIAEVGVFWTNMLPLVWSWYIFAANTAMTFSAIYSIVCVAVPSIIHMADCSIKTRCYSREAPHHRRLHRLRDSRPRDNGVFDDCMGCLAG